MKKTLCLLALAVLCLGASYGADSYSVRLHRPFHRGDTYVHKATVTQTDAMRTWSQDKPAGEQNRSFRFTVDVRSNVVSVNDKGQIVRETHTVLQCTYQENDRVAPTAVKRGAVIESRIEGGRSVYTIDGQPAGAQESLLLSMALPLQGISPTDDEMFGTDQARELGQSWDVDRDVVAGMLQGMGLGTVATAVNGKTTLNKIEPGEEGEVMVVSTTMRVEPLMQPLPKMLKFKSGHMEWVGETRLPVAPDRMRILDRSKLAMRCTAVGGARPDGGGPALVRVESSTVQESQHRYELVK